MSNRQRRVASRDPRRSPRTPGDGRRTTRLVLWLCGLMALASATNPSHARADSTVIVLSIRALDGDDELAHRLSDALRVGAAKVSGWQNSEFRFDAYEPSLRMENTVPS